MKTFVLGLLFLGLTNLMSAQNDIAYVSIDETALRSTTVKTVINADYLKAIKVNAIPERVRAFQRVVANYDLKENTIYSANSLSQYNVVFREGKNTIKAIFDHNGTIVQCEETFVSVRVPYFLSMEITKEYPGWSYENVWCYINYSEDNVAEVKYKVVLRNGSKRKTIMIDASQYI